MAYTAPKHIQVHQLVMGRGRDILTEQSPLKTRPFRSAYMPIRAVRLSIINNVH